VHSPEFKRMLKMFDGDFRVYRVVMESKNPIDTLHNLRNDKYSIITFFDMLEMLDIRNTLEEDSEYQRRALQRNKQ